MLKNCLPAKNIPIFVTDQSIKNANFYELRKRFNLDHQLDHHELPKKIFSCQNTMLFIANHF